LLSNWVNLCRYAVVTDEPFTEPWLTPCRKLASGTFPAPVWAVDAACVVPVRHVVGGPCTS
jgi:hypothetical protein